MKAIALESFGSPAVLVEREVGEPVLDETSVAIDVEVAVINHIDLDIRAGTSRFPVRLPHRLGREAAGVVVGIGGRVTRWALGDRVLVSAYPSCRRCRFCRAGAVNLCERPRRPGIDVPGGYAELLVAPEDGLFGVPDAVSLENAACAQLAFGTSWHALVTRGRLAPGETVLVLAAASGTGTAAVQIARLAGAHVIGAVGSPHKSERVRALGAEAVVVYGDGDDLATEVEAHLGKRAVDIALDGVGGALFGEALRLLRPGGRLVTYGAHGGESVAFDLIEFFRSYTEVIASRGWREPEVELVLAEMAAGRLCAEVGRELPLAEAFAGHELLEQREIVGKVLLRA